MTRRSFAAAVLFALAGTAPAADTKLTVKAEDTPPPKELGEAVRGLLDSKGLTVSDGAGKVICTVWPRKAFESKATAAQAAAGLTYANLDETTVLGAIRFPEGWSDYRKQKVKPGVYTLRLGLQPMDGDHMGTAPYNEFALLAPAGKDAKPDLMTAEELHELSSTSTTRKHPGIVLLFPNPKPAAAPAVEAKPQDHWVLSYQVPVTAGGKKAALGFSLVVVGHSMAE
jgi:hypothetical protein